MSFPLLAKTDVNGPDRHPLYAELTKTPDSSGEVVKRFSPRTVPDAPKVVDAIEGVLPK